MRKLIVLCIVIAATQFGCGALNGIAGVAAKVLDATPFLGHAIDLADQGSEMYFARHPSREQDSVRAAVFDARQALTALEALATLGEAAGAGDLARARTAALDAYNALFTLLQAHGIPAAKPPLGGAEAEGVPIPQPFTLPTPSEVEARIP